MALRPRGGQLELGGHQVALGRGDRDAWIQASSWTGPYVVGQRASVSRAGAPPPGSVRSHARCVPTVRVASGQPPSTMRSKRSSKSSVSITVGSVSSSSYPPATSSAGQVTPIHKTCRGGAPTPSPNLRPRRSRLPVRRSPHRRGIRHRSLPRAQPAHRARASRRPGNLRTRSRPIPGRARLGRPRAAAPANDDRPSVAMATSVLAPSNCGHHFARPASLTLAPAISASLPRPPPAKGRLFVLAVVPALCRDPGHRASRTFASLCDAHVGTVVAAGPAMRIPKSAMVALNEMFTPPLLNLRGRGKTSWRSRRRRRLNADSRSATNGCMVICSVDLARIRAAY